MKTTVIALALSLGLNVTPSGQVANEISELGFLSTDTHELSTFDMLAPKQTSNTNETQLQATQSYALITNYQFKATGKNELTNINDNTDKIETKKALEVGKEYVVRLKGEKLISIEK